MGRKSKTKFRVGQTVQSIYDSTHTFVIDKSAQTSDMESEQERMLCSLMWRLFALDIVDGGDPLRHHPRLVMAINKKIDGLLKGMTMEEQECAMCRALRSMKKEWKEQVENLAMELESNRPGRCRIPSP